MASASSETAQRLERYATLATAVAAVASWAALFARLSDPARLPFGYDSDSALPVMMSNADHLGFESLYLWSTDRFSGLPFALFSLFHQATGFFWTPSALALALTAWVAISIAVVWRWTGDAAVTALWALALVAGPWRELLFDIRQPVAWQLTWTLLALMACERQRPVALFAFTLLAHSANAMTGLWLIAIVILWRERWPSLLAVVLAIGVELVIRGIAQVHWRDAYGYSIATKTTIVLRGFAGHYAAAFSHVSALWLAVLAVAFLRDTPRWARYLSVCAALNVALPPLVRHIQDNDVAARYFTLAGVIAPFIAAVILMQWRRLAFFAAAALLFAVGPIFHRSPKDPSWETNLTVANSLAELKPGTPLSSGYWETYTLASLVPNGRLPGISRASQTQRTPFLWDTLGDEVWVGNQGNDRDAFIDFSAHVQVGRDVFVPEGREVGVEGRTYRLYRKVTTVTRVRGQACENKPLVVPSAGATRAVAFNARGEELSVEDFQVRPLLGCVDAQAFAITP